MTFRSCPRMSSLQETESLGRFIQGLILFSLLCLNMPATASPISPKQFTANGHYYDIIYGSFSRDEAAADALTRNHSGKKGHLATITTAEEDDFLRGLLHDFTTTHSGHSTVTAWLDGSWDGSSPASSGSAASTTGWSWGDTGESFHGYQNWKSSQPDHKDSKDNSKTADVTAYYYDSSSDSGKWEDDSRDRKDLSGYLIEYEDDVPEPNVLALLAFGLATIVSMGGAKPRQPGFADS